MEYKIEYSLEAEQAIADIISYYELVDGDYSNKLYTELSKTQMFIAMNPLMYQIRYESIRKANLKKFPFSLFYIIDENKIVILNVIHQSRDPKFWPEI